MSNDQRRHNTLVPPETWDGLGREISARIETLAQISDVPGQLTRLYLNPAHRRSADVVADWMRGADMAVRVDATSTVVGRYEGSPLSQMGVRKTLILGSHIDTVRDAGRFDGTLGVLAPLAVVGRLARAGVRLPFDIEVVAFGDEEGVRFPSTLTGSRALAGRFDAKTLDETDADGVTRGAALRQFGCDPTGIAAETRDPASVLGYVEVHIEQGPVLETRGIAVGVVTAISGASRGRVVVRGEAGHAGTVPMMLRKDALVAASEMVLAVEARAREANEGVVATVGRLEVANAAVNTVAGHVEFTLDIRAPDDGDRLGLVAAIRSGLGEIAARRGVSAEVALTYEASAVACDGTLVQGLADAVARQGHEMLRLASGAGHDAMSFGGVIPAAMLFVRCRGGVSHAPTEFTSEADIDAAARVLVDFVLGLADAA